ncbi:HYC_CC_PP family protein [Flavobacterium nackdongense]|uniref:Uncharacterized protein n=1 Tax=Flavobacterium nackdongense TaxID=2547394 RepID=A0A4P6YDC9_9FLAO|nr:hypothetical protein [Flavobacterium nackdongense]QBN18765.1 hypothetical protein E1750_08095 [Flavobacterium nackdongense]
MNFKKHLSFVLAVFLLVSNTGFAIDVHYCGGEIASVNPVFYKNYESLIANEESCCAPKTINILEKKGSCCQDKLIHFEKKSENVTINSPLFQAEYNFIIVKWESVFFAEYSNFENNRIRPYYCDANAPPLFKLYHQYIFYA